MNRNLTLLTLALIAFALLGTAARAAEQRPNVVFILADDLGWMDTSLYGSDFYETPNIDRLAERGMMFTNAYTANPLCSPTRASIMTGLHPARIGMTAPRGHLRQVVLEPGLRKNAPPYSRALVAESVTRLKRDYHTLAEAFQEAGYATGHFGKWHLGREPYGPLQQGFDVDVPGWWGPGPAGSYVAPWRYPPNLDFEGQPGEHIEDRMAEEAIDFLEQHRDGPFFLNYWAFSVHGPFDAKEKLIERYRDKADPNAPQRNPIMGAMVHSLDENVGRLMQALDDLGITDDTIVIFFSDNGGVHFIEREGSPLTSNAPLRGGKATIYEGGTRVPCIVVWPGTTRPGSRSDAIIQSIDFYPTLLEMAGMEPKEGREFDGVSIVPALKGRPLERNTIFCHFPHQTPASGGLPSTYVRKGDWKLIRFYAGNEGRTDRLELYNLKEDIGETENLAARMPEKTKELNALISRFLEETDAIVPVPNPNYDPQAEVPERRL